MSLQALGISRSPLVFSSPAPLTQMARGAAKATDENLTSEDWGAIIEVCDKVSGDANGPKEAVQSLMKRLAHRNANVQLYTLEVGQIIALFSRFLFPFQRDLAQPDPFAPPFFDGLLGEALLLMHPD